MKCAVEEIPGTDEGNGWRMVRCRRVGCGLHEKPFRAKGVVMARCRGYPLPHEWREWLALFSAATGVTQAMATVAYIRWRFKGSPLDQLPPGVPRPRLAEVPAPEEGPGTELKKLLDSLGVVPVKGCQCAARQAEMNRGGPRWCVDNREKLLTWLKEAYDESALTTKAVALGMALAKGLPLTLAGILAEAIRRAELASAAAGR